MHLWIFGSIYRRKHKERCKKILEKIITLVVQGRGDIEFLYKSLYCSVCYGKHALFFTFKICKLQKHKKMSLQIIHKTVRILLIKT